MQSQFIQPYIPQVKNQIFWQAIADKNYPLVNQLATLNPNLFFNRDENGTLPIVSAMENHDLELFKSLMANPAFYSFYVGEGNSLALLAIKKGNLEIFDHIIQVNPNLLTLENHYGEVPIFEILKKNHEQMFDFISENYPKLMFFKNRFGKSMVHESMESGNPRFFAEILKKFPKVSSFFDDDFQDPSRNNFIYIVDNHFFRDALTHISQDELREIINYDSEFESLLNKIMRSNRFDLLLSILEKVPDIFDDFENISVLHHAVDKKIKNPNSLMPIQLFFSQVFGFNQMDKDTVNFLKDFFDVAVVLLLTNLDEDFVVDAEGFLESHKRINEKAKKYFEDDNKFYEIYNLIYDVLEKPKEEKFIEGVDGKFLILKSNIIKHTSFFVFKFDKNNKITEVSYCDGNQVYDQQEIDGNAEQIFATTTFKLAHPIENTQGFIDEFMGLNSSNTDFYSFYQRGIVFPRGVEYQKSYSVPCKKQNRGNCTIKSLNILAQFMANQLNPNPVEYSLDSNGKLSTDDKDRYKLHKNNIVEYCGDSLDFVIEKLESKANKNKLEEFFLKKAKEIIDICENKQIDKARRDFEAGRGGMGSDRMGSDRMGSDRMPSPSTSTPSVVADISPAKGGGSPSLI